jgi:hypothetical protein
VDGGSQLTGWLDPTSSSSHRSRGWFKFLDTRRTQPVLEDYIKI